MSPPSQGWDQLCTGDSTLNFPETNSDLSEALNFVKSRAPRNYKPELALVLGSGLSASLPDIQSLLTLPYGEIPGFFVPGVSGHKGELILCEIRDRQVLVLSGRIHYYEGYTMAQVTFSVRLSAILGAKAIILTSSVGAVNPKFRVGDIITVKDHINLMGANPLRCKEWNQCPDGSQIFPDLSECYSKSLQKLSLVLAKKNKLRCRSGVYCALSGPSYETPAEVRAFRKIGADVVGMSMVPEAVAARQMGLNILGLCAITNMAAGVSGDPLDHTDVLSAGARASKKLSILIPELIANLP